MNESARVAALQREKAALTALLPAGQVSCLVYRQPDGLSWAPNHACKDFTGQAHFFLTKCVLCYYGDVKATEALRRSAESAGACLGEGQAEAVWALNVAEAASRGVLSARLQKRLWIAHYYEDDDSYSVEHFPHTPEGLEAMLAKRREQGESLPEDFEIQDPARFLESCYEVEIKDFTRASLDAIEIVLAGMTAGKPEPTVQGFYVPGTRELDMELFYLRHPRFKGNKDSVRQGRRRFLKEHGMEPIGRNRWRGPDEKCRALEGR